MRWEWVFNGRLNSQIWHHKAKTHKSHPEGWCRLDCGRFMRIFFLYFSIPMLKNPMELSTLQVYNISHFFFLCKLNLTWRTQEKKKKNLALFSFYLRRDGWRGSEGGSWEKRATQQAPKSKIKKKKNPNKNTHTENGTPAHELKKKQKKKYVNDACFKGEHEELCWDLWTLCKWGVAVCVKKQKQKQQKNRLASYGEFQIGNPWARHPFPPQFKNSHHHHHQRGAGCVCEGGGGQLWGGANSVGEGARW